MVGGSPPLPADVKIGGLRRLRTVGKVGGLRGPGKGGLDPAEASLLSYVPLRVFFVSP